MRSNNWFPRVGIRFTVGLIILIITTLISRTALQLKSTESMVSELREKGKTMWKISSQALSSSFFLTWFLLWHFDCLPWNLFMFTLRTTAIISTLSLESAFWRLSVLVWPVTSWFVPEGFHHEPCTFQGQLEMHIFYDFSLVVLITDLHYVIRQKAFLSCAQYKREGPTTFIDWTA